MKERKLHTELGCLYVQYINRILNKKYKKEDSEGAEEVNFDVEAALKDENIIDLRNRLRDFLSTSTTYDPNTILPFITPIQFLLKKELSLIKMKQARFEESLQICLKDVKDVSFAKSLAKKGFEWHNKDRRVYYNLFKLLL